MNRFVKIEQPVIIRDIVNNTPKFTNRQTDEPIAFSFRDFLLGTLADPKFGKTLSMLMVAASIKQKTEVCYKNKSQFLEIDEEEWKILCSVINEPSVPYDPKLAIWCVPFFHAIVRAGTQADQAAGQQKNFEW